jgi:hypothetical protein
VFIWFLKFILKDHQLFFMQNKWKGPKLKKCDPKLYAIFDKYNTFSLTNTTFFNL